MEATLINAVALPIGLGLLGFVEPCTVGAHLIFLGTQEGRARRDAARALAVFIGVRVMVTGAFGAAAVFIGTRLISAQTMLWLVFGLLYLLIGAMFILGRAGSVKRRIVLAPSTWRRASNPFVLGAAFGLNIPACAAPILFALLGVAMSGGSLLTGFAMMALFGLALSAPLVPVALFPALARALLRTSEWLRPRRWILGVVFLVLGTWSIWFGLFVDPADWSGT